LRLPPPIARPVAIAVGKGYQYDGSRGAGFFEKGEAQGADDALLMLEKLVGYMNERGILVFARASNVGLY